MKILDSGDNLTEGPYTTLSVAEYNRLQNVLTILRWKIQKAREFLEQNKAEEAKRLLTKAEDER